LRNEKIGFKIREHTIQRTPYLIIVGDQEMENGTLAVRTREGKDLGSMSLVDFIEMLAADITQRGRVTH
jgi:threonyl-tRNA synthetase